MRDLWRSIGMTSGARIYSLVAGTISLIITARALGPAGRGTVAAVLTWAGLFAIVGYLSLGQVAIHRGAGKPVSEWLGSTLAALLLMTGVVSVVGWTVAAASYAFSDGRFFGDLPAYALVLGFAMLPLLIWEQYGSSLLMAVGRLSIYNRAEIVGRTVGILLVVVLVALAGVGVAGALIALIVAQTVVAGAGMRHLVRRAGKTLAYSRSTLRDLLTGGLKLHLNAVGTFLYTSAAVLIVHHLRGPAETGSFQIVTQLMVVALIIPQAASMVLYSEVARLGADGAWPANRRILLSMVPLMGGVALIGALTAPTLLPLVVGDAFSDAVPVFQLLAVALIGQSVSTVMAPQWIGRGLFWQASALTVGLGVCNVAACIPLVHAYGMKGAAYSLIGVSVASVIGNGTLALLIERRATRTNRAALSHVP